MDEGGSDQERALRREEQAGPGRDARAVAAARRRFGRGRRGTGLEPAPVSPQGGGGLGGGAAALMDPPDDRAG